MMRNKLKPKYRNVCCRFVGNGTLKAIHKNHPRNPIDQKYLPNDRQILNQREGPDCYCLSMQIKIYGVETEQVKRL